MNRIADMITALVKSAVTQTEFDKEAFAPITDADIEALLSLSSRHSLAHIIGFALKNNNLLTESDASEKFEKKMFTAVLAHEKMQWEYDRICNTLEENGIAYMPLKGAVIRKYYPEPWMRNSCDIDILVHEKDIENAVNVLHSKLDYTVGEKAYHDVSLFSENHVHLELHFNILENTENIDKALLRVWDYSIPSDNRNQKFAYFQTNEYLLFHNIAHMTYHFLNGGCGIRPFVDIYLMISELEYDDSVVRELCKECGIETFYNRILDLIAVWFSGKSHNRTTEMMEKYIFQGGVFGTLGNSVAVGQATKGGRLKYILHRVFMPYDELIHLYPNLAKGKWLLPFYEICRWFRLVFMGGIGRSVAEIKTSQRLDSRKANYISDLLSDLGLE